MRIETIRVRNFKALQNIELTNLPAFCVFVGKNGSGKTTLFRVFAFLKQCLEHNVRSALNAEGGRNGFKDVATRGHELEPIYIEIQFRVEIAGFTRLVTYSLQIGLNEDGLPVVQREILKYDRNDAGKPFHFLDFHFGAGYAITNEEDFSKPDDELEREPQKLHAVDTLAIKGLGQFERFKAAHAVCTLIEDWHVSDFHINDIRGVKDDKDAQHLSADGSNLPAFARYMLEQHPVEFDIVKRKMRERVPEISDIEIRVAEDGRLLVRYQDAAYSEPFIDKNVSDGTVKLFAYLLLLHDPKPYPVICLEEPENHLYPQLMTLLAEEFLLYTQRGGQVFVSTHSPQFLNAVPLESVFHIDKVNGVARIVSISQDPLLASQMVAGDKAGYLWEQGMFRGVAERVHRR